MFSYKYPRPALTADIVLIDTASREVLLIRRLKDPFANHWAFPGGFFEESDPDIEATAARELQEETGLSNLPLELLCIASRQDRDPRGRTVSAVFLGLVNHHNLNAIGADDAAEARWFSLDQLPPLAFDHDEIIRKAINKVYNT